LQKKFLRKIYLFLSAAVGWFIMSLILLTLPGTAFPTEDWFDKIWLDKWIHVGLFGILAWLWCNYWRHVKTNEASSELRRSFIIIGLIFLGYGIAMEFVQKYFIPYRSFDVGDIMADAIGCTIGAVFSIKRYIKK